MAILNWTQGLLCDKMFSNERCNLKIMDTCTSDIIVLFFSSTVFLFSCSIAEPVYNNIVLQPEVTNGIENAEYAKVIPRSQRNVTNAESDNQDNAEYAVVIPKSQREPKQQDAINENEVSWKNDFTRYQRKLGFHDPDDGFFFISN